MAHGSRSFILVDLQSVHSYKTGTQRAISETQRLEKQTSLQSESSPRSRIERARIAESVESKQKPQLLDTAFGHCCAAAAAAAAVAARRHTLCRCALELPKWPHRLGLGTLVSRATSQLGTRTLALKVSAPTDASSSFAFLVQSSCGQRTCCY